MDHGVEINGSKNQNVVYYVNNIKIKSKKKKSSYLVLLWKMNCSTQILSKNV